MHTESFKYVHPAGGFGRRITLSICAVLLALSGALAIAGDEVPSEQVEYHILAAEMAGQRGQSQMAAEEYLKALRLAPGLELAQRATQVAAYAGDAALTLEAATQWAELAPEKLEPRIILMQAAVQLGEVQGAIKHALFVIDRHPKGAPQAFRDIAHALSSSTGNPSSALGVMDGLRQEYTDMPAAEYATALLALNLGSFAVAVDAAQRAIGLRDDWQEALLLKATALLRLEKVAQAVQTVDSAGLDDNHQIELHLAFARQLLEEDLQEEAVGQYRQVLALNGEQPEALYAMGILQINLGNNDAAYDYFLTLHEDVGLRPDISAFYLCSIEESRGHYDKALQWYEKVGDGERYIDAAQRKAFVYYKLGRLAEAREWLAELRADNPDMAVQFYLAEGELLYEAGRFEDAMALYNTALEEHPDHLDLLYGRSLIAERMGRLTLTERDLRRILELEPDDARTLNALGYVLANHTRRYEEALGYISRALEQNPNDAAVIDSMGWVKYRMGDMQTALEYLQDAFDRMPDPEVAAHLGEVLWVLGRREDARHILEEALREDPDHPVLRDTIQRLTR